MTNPTSEPANPERTSIDQLEASHEIANGLLTEYLDKSDGEPSVEDFEAWTAERSNPHVRAGRLGEKTMGGLIFVLGTIPWFFKGVLARAMKYSPVKSYSFWRNWIRFGYKGMLKATGANAIAHNMRQGHLDHVPVDFDPQSNQWESQISERYWLSSDGHQTLHVGKVPAVWMSNGAHELGSNVKARVAEKLDQGDGKPLYSDAQVTVNATLLDGDAADAGSGAVADGGAVVESIDWQPDGILEDYIIPEDNAPLAVSMEKYYETAMAKVAPDEMKKQEERGMLAVLDDDMKGYALKMLIVAGLIIVGALVLPGLLGGGGGGGISLPTLSTMPVGWF